MSDAEGKIRLLIVDDSVFFRKALTDALAGDPRIQVIGTAVDAMDAMERGGAYLKEQRQKKRG